MGIDVFLHAHAVSPLPASDAAETAIGCGTIAVVADIVGENVVTSVGQVLVLDHEVNFDRVIIAPGLPEMTWKSGAAHW
jgi:hypothetical protein